MKALGMVEVYGRLGAVEALDSALKAANVSLVNLIKVGGGLSTVLVEGDVGAVKAAIDAAEVAAKKVSKVISIHVIPRPDESVRKLIGLEEVHSEKENDEPTNTHEINVQEEINSDETNSDNELEQEFDNQENTDETVPEDLQDELEEQKNSVLENNEVNEDSLINHEQDLDKTVNEDISTPEDVEPENSDLQVDEKLAEINEKSELTENQTPKEDTSKTDAVKYTRAQLEKMTVRELRKIANSIEDFSLTKKQIQTVNKKVLVDNLDKMKK